MRREIERFINVHFFTGPLAIVVILALLWHDASQAQISCTSSVSALAAIPTSTVAGLPACNAGNNGSVYLVTNALTPIVLSLVVGGGAVNTLVHCNGANFVVG